ncbi:hypothetical protein IE4771_PB00398 (plasmid) [Rhizobium etli bv. mimosae str. IE4771]|uniref:Uncharacterized protein n=1 Tax=Rhizobium etli bv. mimosae str. IE4771 TaxID=1432050 RepID=A0A060I8X4_RHIET|nr:hypothetical protein IE4771_PB00398 [Rhizobium sp. IE4771]
MSLSIGVERRELITNRNWASVVESYKVFAVSRDFWMTRLANLFCFLPKSPEALLLDSQ